MLWQGPEIDHTKPSFQIPLNIHCYLVISFNVLTVETTWLNKKITKNCYDIWGLRGCEIDDGVFFWVLVSGVVFRKCQSFGEIYCSLLRDCLHLKRWNVGIYHRLYTAVKLRKKHHQEVKFLISFYGGFTVLRNCINIAYVDRVKLFCSLGVADESWKRLERKTNIPSFGTTMILIILSPNSHQSMLAYFHWKQNTLPRTYTYYIVWNLFDYALRQ